MVVGKSGPNASIPSHAPRSGAPGRLIMRYIPGCQLPSREHGKGGVGVTVPAGISAEPKASPFNYGAGGFGGVYPRGVGRCRPLMILESTLSSIGQAGQAAPNLVSLVGDQVLRYHLSTGFGSC